MINITEVKELRNHRYLIKLVKDSKEYTHILPEETIIKHNILGPKSITIQEYNDLLNTSESDELYSKALYFIDYQMRTISEVKKQLKRYSDQEDVIAKIIQKLKEQGYLNDKNYVKEYVNQKIEFDLVGPRRIKEKLIGKGIHFDLINEFLLQYKDEYQYDKIRELLIKETKLPIKKPYIKAYQSLKAKFINKGFDVSIIESTMMNNKDLLEASVDELPLLEKEYLAIKDKYNIEDFKERDQLVKKLLQKGFRYELVKQVLSI